MLTIILGLLVGIITGVVQFFLLYKFVTSVTSGKSGMKTVIFAITQFLFPFLVLVACAFLLQDSLMWVGIGTGASLIVSAIIKFVFVNKATVPEKKKNGKNKKKNK